jgi:hypothetical protein
MATPPQKSQQFKGMSSRRKRIVLVAAAVSVVLIILSSMGILMPMRSSSEYPTSPKTITVRQLTITSGIDDYTSSNGNHSYLWVTSLRATSKDNVVSIKAVLNVTETLPPLVQTSFRIGFYLVKPNNGLNYNQTATADGITLTPAYGDFVHSGQSFPESVTATFRNGTSFKVETSAVVFSYPGLRLRLVAPTIQVLDLTASVNKSDFSGLTVSITLKNTGDATISRILVYPTGDGGTLENVAPGLTVSGTGTVYLYPAPSSGDLIPIAIWGYFADSSHFILNATVTAT